MRVKSARILAIAFLATSCSTVTPEIVAHRGASAEAPENTLEAVQAAWRAGADAVEIDVRLTADGKLAVIHDETTKRTAGLEWVVAEKTLEELQTLDVGSWKGARWKGSRIPSLEEVLAAVPAGKRAFVELKCGPASIPELVRGIGASGKAPGEIACIGFDPETMAAVRGALPGVKVYLLSGFRREKETGRWEPEIDKLIEKARAAGFHGLDLCAEGPLDAAAAKRIRAAGLELHVWTVNEAETARKLRSLGVDSITTDRPAEIRRALEGS